MIAAIKEAKKVRWPSFKETKNNTVSVMLFIGIFALFFVLCDFITTIALKIIGI